MATSSIPEAPKSKDIGREDGNSRQPTDYPVRHVAMTQKPSDSPHRQPGGRVNPSDNHKKESRVSASSDRSFERSPLHPHDQVKSSGKGRVASTSLEKRNSSEGHGHAPNIPGRSKMKPGARGSETPDKGSSSALPKFGEWNDNNPQAGEGYTDIFNKVSEEKKLGIAKVPMISKETPYRRGSPQKKKGSDYAECVCFGWCRK